MTIGTLSSNSRGFFIDVTMAASIKRGRRPIGIVRGALREAGGRFVPFLASAAFLLSPIAGPTAHAQIVGVGTFPVAIAENQATNTSYVANFDSNSVTVINGATNATTTVTAGTNPDALSLIHI